MEDQHSTPLSPEDDFLFWGLLADEDTFLRVLRNGRDLSPEELHIAGKYHRDRSRLVREERRARMIYGVALCSRENARRDFEECHPNAEREALLRSMEEAYVQGQCEQFGMSMLSAMG